MTAAENAAERRAFAVVVVVVVGKGTVEIAAAAAAARHILRSFARCNSEVEAAAAGGNTAGNCHLRAIPLKTFAARQPPPQLLLFH